MAVLDLLKAQKAPVSLKELITQLGSDYSERTVRRWLAAFVSDGAIEKTGKKRAARYYVPQSPSPQTIYHFSQNSLPAIIYVSRPIFERKPVSYHYEWIQNYCPGKTYYLSAATRQQLYLAGLRQHSHDPAGTYVHRIYNRLLIDLSYNSSRLEGNTYSLLETQRLILEGANAQGKLDTERVMILNHKEAIRYLIENAGKLEIESREIYTLHFLLSDGLVTTEYAGKVRDYGVRVSGSTYMPLDHVHRLEKQIQLVCQKAVQIDDPYEQSFFLLIHISYLQAFVDVNKRTARLSANIPLIKNNYVPLSFNDIDKSDYMLAITAIYELNDTKPLEELYVASYLRTCQFYDVAVDAVGLDEIRVRYRQLRRDLIRHIVTRLLTGEKLDKYIENKARQHITAADQAAFVEDIREDLKELSPSRIAGIGISIIELEKWRQKNN